MFKNDKYEITKFFNALEEQLDEVLCYVSRCREEFNNGIKNIDKCLANRILQYISYDNQKLEIVDTERDVNANIFNIIIRHTGMKVELDTGKYSKITTEKIKVKPVR